MSNRANVAGVGRMRARPEARRRRARGTLVGALALALTASLAGPAPAQARPAAPPRHLTAQAEPTDDHGGEVRGQAWPVRSQPYTPAPAPRWPQAGTARVALPPGGARGVGAPGGVRAGALPVWVDRAPGAAGARLTEVRVDLLDRQRVPAAWRHGVVARVGAAAGSPAGTARVTVDYAAFRSAFGGDWASRLRLWRLPECALTAPGTPGCAATPLRSLHHNSGSAVSAEVALPALGGSRAADSKARLAGNAHGAAPQGVLVALAAGPSGPSGDFTATALSASATWSAGGSAGAFSWDYPMRTPPAINGPKPGITLAYSSAGVDGRSSATNNQPSAVGEGFEYSPGHIERRYVSCADDMAGAAKNTTRTGDLCWRSDNATMILNGKGTELVYEAGKGWHGRSEDGSRIEKLTGAANGDDDGEYWKVTGPDGVQYFFGRHSLPGHTATTNSADTVRVYGNHPNEPCTASTFAGSGCAQAWRWNLDYVVDPRGNTMSYWYSQETNKYATRNTDSATVSYVRGSFLTRIDYGTWDRGSTDRSVTPTAQVVFTAGDRCVSNCATRGQNWPDVPWDQECAASATSCAGRYSPTFWSTRRLAKVTTRVWDTTKATPAWQDVESWTLTHSFPSPGDGSVHAGLWLASIRHAGHVGGTVTMPPVTFEPTSLANRVLTRTNTSNNWHRIANIITETGAKIQVTYSLAECSSGNLPSAAHTNTKRCYPVIGVDPHDPYGTNLITEWWHKYVVTAVAEADVQIQGGHQAPTKFTRYEYEGAPAWHYADDDGLTKPDRKTWSQFRGYETVRTRVGEVPGQQTLTISRYLRGMHGDRAAPSGGTRTVTVPASIGAETVYDEDQFAGMLREQTVYDGVESRPVSRTVHVPWRSAPTASRTVNGDTVTARFVRTRVTYQATALGVHGARGWRTARTVSDFDGAYGTVNWTLDDGDWPATGDEQCTTYVYNRNLAKNLLTPVKRQTTTALACGAAPASPDDVVADVRHTFDGAVSPDTAPVYGAVTRTEQMKDWSAAGGTVWQTTSQGTYDAFGRVLTTTDIRGNTTTVAYTPASGGPVTKVTSTSPAPYNWVTTTDLAPYWGATVKATDPNGRVTDVEYDALGRVAKVWKIGWSKASNPTRPSAEYSYVFSATRSAYPYVQAKVIHAKGGYRTTYHIADAFLRPRQTQTDAIGGGRVVTDTVYDQLGRVEVSYSPHVEPGTPSGVLWWEPEWSVPALTRTVYDNANRVTDSIFLGTDGVTNLVEKWRTSTAYEGDLTRTTPPDGGTPTTVLTDIRGRSVELRQHTTAQGVAGGYDRLSYHYNRKGQLARVTDAGGNEWSYTYDLKGRKVETRDPDKGLTRTDYNDANDVVKSTDARGEVLVYTYDQLGRKTGLYDDAVSPATKRAEWKYDRLYSMLTVRGQLTEAIRYDPPGSANAYTWRAINYNARYQLSGEHFVIPAVEGPGLSGTYSFGYSYSPSDGTPSGQNYPSGGGLASEGVDTIFDPTTGLPSSMDTTLPGLGRYVALQQYTAYGEPALTMRKIDGGVYVEDLTSYDLTTRRVTRTRVLPESTAGTVSDRAYDYDAAGNIISIAETPQVGVADQQCFRYDRLRRLTTAWTPMPTTNCRTTSPSLAGMGGPAAYWLDWTFDTIGNRRTEVSHAPAGDTTRTYAYPAPGAGVALPHAVTGVTTAAPGQPGVTHRYDYDPAGNTTCRPHGAAGNDCAPSGTGSQRLTWDAEDRLASVSDAAQTVEMNVYTADGRRLVRRDATSTTIYLSGMELRREGTTVTATRYYTFNGRTIASRTPAGASWVYSDHQGTQHMTVGILNHAVNVRRQLPYGGPRGPQPSWVNRKGFVGGDPALTGLTNIGARQYDPALGRFVSVDPIMDLADPQQINPYAYANNNPVTFSDPTGLYTDRSGGDGHATYAGSPETMGCAWNDSCKKPQTATENMQDFTRGFVNKVARYNHDVVAGTYQLITHPVDTAKQYWTEVEYYTDRDGGGWNYIYGVHCANIGHCKLLDEVANGNYEAAGESTAGLVGDSAAFVAGGVGGATRGASLAGRLGRRGCGNSFVAGTPVLLADGSAKAIEMLQEGEFVLATDPSTGTTEAKAIIATIVGEGVKDLVEITVEGSGGSVVATGNHPFWVADLERWVDAADLRPGQWLRTSAGTWVQVKALKKWSEHAQVFNLTIADIHTYYVLAGNTSVLVHNDGGEEYLYRGVPWGHPGLEEARRGVATPWGGHDDPDLHAGGNTRSNFTSWTTDPDIALDISREGGGPGVVLRVRKSEVASQIVKANYAYDESEVTLRGQVTGATTRSSVTGAVFKQC
ncbi:MAG TPA: polymorphic toxin-type HINT domain-containing protein [Pilimelia sp.]|nr:polymorphic toxin-type HINT domain-containing protein [Pilimelia sp.]